MYMYLFTGNRKYTKKGRLDSCTRDRTRTSWMVETTTNKVLVQKYRLHHEVEVSMLFTHRGPKARGCVNHIETDTEWCNQLVPWSCADKSIDYTSAVIIHLPIKRLYRSCKKTCRWINIYSPDKRWISDLFTSCTATWLVRSYKPWYKQ